MATAASTPAPTAAPSTEATAPVVSESLSTPGPASTVTEASAPTTYDVVLEQQGLTDVSEADLRGESTPENKPVPSEPSVEVKPEVKAEEPKVEEPKTEEAKPPKGYVPLAAIHEVRGENKYLKEQIAELTNRLANPVTTTVPDDSAPDGFVELSDAEFLALSDESPKDALLYMKQLNQHSEQRRLNETLNEKTQLLYDSVSNEMEQVVPGILSDTSVAEEFREFATSLGFTDDLFYLTNPSTMVILPGQSEPVLLGDQAAKIIRMLANVKKGQPAAPVDIEAITTKIKAELETEIMAKLKTGTQFRSLTAVPTSDESRPEFNNAVLTEAQFMKLSAKEQDLYLSGQ